MYCSIWKSLPLVSRNKRPRRFSILVDLLSFFNLGSIIFDFKRKTLDISTKQVLYFSLISFKYDFVVCGLTQIRIMVLAIC